MLQNLKKKKLKKSPKNLLSRMLKKMKSIRTQKTSLLRKNRKNTTRRKKIFRNRKRMLENSQMSISRTSLRPSGLLPPLRNLLQRELLLLLKPLLQARSIKLPKLLPRSLLKNNRLQKKLQQEKHPEPDVREKLNLSMKLKLKKRKTNSKNLLMNRLSMLQ